MGARLFGRETELSMLLQLCRASASSRRGGPAAALVVGDPGSGKSSLLGELRDQLGSVRGLDIRGYEPEQRIALAAGRDLLRTLNVPYADGTGDATSVAVFEAAHRALGRDPVVLYVDDLHWVDEASIALCHYLIRAAVTEHRPMATVAAGRPSRRVRELGRSLDQLGVRRASVTLGPLDRADAIRLVRDVDRSIGDADAETLWRASAG
jgi:predicted ATPase